MNGIALFICHRKFHNNFAGVLPFRRLTESTVNLLTSHSSAPFVCRTVLYFNTIHGQQICATVHSLFDAPLTHNHWFSGHQPLVREPKMGERNVLCRTR
jgi:hypothetical protein